MVDYKYKDLFDENSINHQLVIECEEGTTIDNTMLHAEEFELSQSICSELDLVFGSCEASSVQFTTSKVSNSLKGQLITIKEYMNNNTDDLFVYGTYKVDSDVYTADHSKRTIKAYDSMYDILKTDIAEWYKGLTFPIAQKSFRDSLFAFLGIEQINTTLVNDNVLFERTIDSNTILCGDVLKAMCEINGVFGHISNNNKFGYINLNDSQTVNVSTYMPPVEYEDYTKLSATGVTIKQTSNDVGASVGTEENEYIVLGNILCYGMTTEQLQVVAQNLYSVIRTISYRPFDITMRANPCNEVGDKIHVETAKGNIIDSYILRRRLTGIQGKRDNLVADGEEYFANDRTNVDSEVKQLSQKTNELSRTVDGTVSTVTRLETDFNNMSVGTKNILNDSEYAMCFIPLDIEYITDENGIALTDSMNDYIYA